MKVLTDITTFTQLYETSWGGAKEVLQGLADEGIEQEAFAYLEDLIEDCYPGGIDETALNDLIWFELEDLLTEAGLYHEEE